MRKLKKSIAAILAVIMVIAMTPTAVFAATGNFNSNIAYTLNETSGALTITGTGELDIRDATTNTTTFEGNTKIKTVTIDAEITRIPASMFVDCTALTSVTLPSTLKEIGGEAFRGCKNLTSITLPESLETIKENAFHGCKKLTEVTLPDGLKTIKDFAFHNTGITNLNIPASVTSVSYIATGLTTVTVDPANAKYDSRNNCNAIMETATNKLIQGSSNTIIPEGTTEIGEYAFYANPITNIAIPDGVTKIGFLAFSKATQLTSLSIPDTVTEIGYSICSGCVKLTTANLPANITEIPNEIFYNCKRLTNINIPENVTNIGQMAFYNCRAFTEVNLPDGLKSVGMEAFYGLKNITEFYFPDSVTDIGMKPLGDCPNLTKVHLPENLKAIPDCMFENCTKLTEWNMPQHITKIGYRAFAGTAVGNPVIPNTVTKIEVGAWQECPNITEIIVPSSVTEIEDWALLCHSVTDENPLKIIFLGNTKIDTIWRNIPMYTEVIAPANGWMVKYVGNFPDDNIELTTYEGEYTIECDTHDFGNPVYNENEATHTYTCAKCGKTETEDCEFDVIKIVPATCIKDGYILYECEVCKGQYRTIIPSPGHHFITNTAKATFDADGYIETVCTECDEKILTGSSKRMSKAGSTTQTATPKVENGRMIITRLKSVKLSTSSYTWDGSPKRPTITVYDNDGKVVPSSNYTVTYANNTAASSNAKVTVTFKGNYQGTRTVNFSIVKPKSTAKKIKAKVSKTKTASVLKSIGKFLKKLFTRR